MTKNQVFFWTQCIHQLVRHSAVEPTVFMSGEVDGCCWTIKVRVAEWHGECVATEWMQPTQLDLCLIGHRVMWGPQFIVWCPHITWCHHNVVWCPHIAASGLIIQCVRACESVRISQCGAVMPITTQRWPWHANRRWRDRDDPHVTHGTWN